MSYFIPRTTRVYSWAVNRSWLTLYATTALIIAGMVGLWYSTCYRYFDNKINSYHAEQKRIDQECTYVNENKDRVSAMQVALTSLHDELARYGGDRVCYAKSLLIDHLATRQIALQSLSTDKCQDDTAFANHQFSFEGYGSLKNILTIFATTADLPILLQCEHVALTRADDKNWRVQCALKLSSVPTTTT